MNLIVPWTVASSVEVETGGAPRRRTRAGPGSRAAPGPGRTSRRIRDGRVGSSGSILNSKVGEGRDDRGDPTAVRSTPELPSHIPRSGADVQRPDRPRPSRPRIDGRGPMADDRRVPAGHRPSAIDHRPSEPPPRQKDDLPTMPLTLTWKGPDRPARRRRRTSGPRRWPSRRSRPLGFRSSRATRRSSWASCSRIDGRRRRWPPRLRRRPPAGPGAGERDGVGAGRGPWATSAPRLGAGMSGGSIEVEGSAGRLGRGRDARAACSGFAATPATTSARRCPGSRVGMRDGIILVDGEAGDDVGLAMRRGLIAVRGTDGRRGGPGDDRRARSSPSGRSVGARARG